VGPFQHCYLFRRDFLSAIGITHLHLIKFSHSVEDVVRALELFPFADGIKGVGGVPSFVVEPEKGLK